MAFVFDAFLTLTFPAGANEFAVTASSRRCPGAETWEINHSTQDLPPGKGSGRPFRAHDQSLRHELIRRAAVDQSIRRLLMLDSDDEEAERNRQKMQTVDADNSVWIEQVIARRGFPKMADVGRSGIKAAWLLVQHSDSIELQTKVLPMLIPMIKAGDVGQIDYAFLSDRVHLRLGKPQLYGSQFVQSTERPGMLVPALPIADLAVVESNRRNIGLMPLADYACVMQGYANVLPNPPVDDAKGSSTLPGQ